MTKQCGNCRWWDRGNILHIPDKTPISHFIEFEVSKSGNYEYSNDCVDICISHDGYYLNIYGCVEIYELEQILSEMCSLQNKKETF